ncbi:MAG: isopentenyl-diphosphate Delta-isomerase [Tenacibaculum sp.]
MGQEQVILVDKQDRQIGVMEKIEAHKRALLHRAFSVFVFNTKGQLLLQQRAEHKYHSPLLWTNTCCSHQREGESNIEAGKRRLQEEMGFTCQLKEAFSFIYKANFDNGLTEHELDYVLIGNFDGKPKLNPNEVKAYKWMTLKQIKDELKNKPKLYTEWFKIIFKKSYRKILKFT